MEALSFRGRRLQDTLLQRQQPTYSSDVTVHVVVEETNHKLLANFVDDARLTFAQGETKILPLWFSNSGTKPIHEIWIVCGPEDEIWVGVEEDSGGAGECPVYRQQVLFLKQTQRMQKFFNPSIL
jgi:hypothetical protein